MIISAYGLVLLFTSNQSNVLLNASYPPFGIASASMIGLSSYLVMVGIYSSATSLALDAKLRQTIRTYAVKESRLLDSIGMADMERNIQKRIRQMTRDTRETMMEQTGVNSSLSEQEIKQYLSEVLKEANKLRKKANNYEVAFHLLIEVKPTAVVCTTGIWSYVRRRICD